MSYIGNIYGKEKDIEVAAQCFCGSQQCTGETCTRN